MNTRSRKLCISIYLITISLISYTVEVTAFNYTFGFKNNDDLVWKCNVCNINKMNNIFGENWSSTGLFENLSQGKKMRWHIVTAEENSTSLLTNVNIWMWNNGENGDDYDYNTEFAFLKDPDQYASNYNLSFIIPFISFWFPVPVGEYLGALKLNSVYDVDNRVLPTINVQINEDFLQPNIPSERIFIIAIYNTDGILSSLKLYTSGNMVVIDIGFETLPIYVLPSTLGLIGAFFIALFLYIRKKRKN